MSLGAAGPQVLWKKAAPYNFKCRKVVHLPGEALCLSGFSRVWLQSDCAPSYRQGHACKDPQLKIAGTTVSKAASLDSQQGATLHAAKPAALDESSSDMDDAAAAAVGGEPMGEGRERVLKFEVQLYRLREGEYVMDFQVRTIERLT